MSGKKSKVIVIGLDGATWDIICPLIQKNELPTFRYLLENGVYGDLQSCIPPVTFPAWKCYSTGKNPGKLGVYWWSKVNFKKRKFEIHDSKSFKSDELWDYLSKKDYKVGVINMPSTFPPKEVSGFMIAGFPAFEVNDYTYPKELKLELLEDFQYRVNPKHHIHVYKEEALKDIEELINIRFKVAKKYLGYVDFLHLTIFYIDDIMHFFWNDKNLLLKFYKIIDSGIRELIEQDRSNSTIFLMSDHGFTGLKDTFYINEWLYQKNYLFKKKAQIKFLNKLFLNQDNLINITKKTKIFPIILDKVDRSLLIKLKKIIPTKAGEFNEEGAEKIIDFDKSLTVALKQGPIYINKAKLTDSEYEKIRDDISYGLKQIIHPVTKENIIKKVFKKEEVYKGNYLDDAPDLVILTNEGYEVDLILSLSSAPVMWESCKAETTQNKWVGTHKMHGIFLAYGKNIKKGLKINGTKIYDLAPTILHIFKCPLPKDLDGRVIEEIFEDTSVLPKYFITNHNIDDEKYKIRQQIRKLKKFKTI
ncbi:MAG: alkaline phosphatase family protein [Candidatus Methanoperedens sp.]|nr:alkaline phosphatase family protein [Candidatus Methanoperedens sp.]